MIEEYKAAGMKSRQSDGGTGGSGSEKSDVPLSFTIDLESIEERVKAQYARTAQALRRITDILSELPDDSYERYVLERKYIDLQSEVKICRELAISRSTLYDYANRGLDQLLEIGWIRKLVDEERARR